MTAFDETGCFLNYGRKPRGKTQPLLWPVQVHQVLYPAVADDALNLFQITLLRLVQAGSHQADEIAALTGLHTDLIRLIQAQLYSRGLLDDQARELTGAGLAALDEEDAQREQLATGYLFQDAITGQLWPRIEAQLAVIEPVDPQAQFPTFSVERKTGKTWMPFLAKAGRQAISVPDQQAILKAWQDYRADFRAARQLHSAGALPGQIRLSQFQQAAAAPFSARVLVWVSAAHNARLWRISDPFDIREQAWWLDDSLAAMVADNRPLAGRLARLIDQPAPEQQTVEQWLQSLQQQVTFRVTLDYPWLEKEPDLAAVLAPLLELQARLEAEQPHRNDREAAITNSQKLLEVLMQWLIHRFPGDTAALPKVKRHCRDRNKALLLALALPAFTEPVCETLAGQSLSSVRQTLKRPRGSLKGLLFAAALATAGKDNHPLQTLSAAQLQLDKLLALAELRNQTSHGNSRYTGKEYTEITVEIAQAQIAYALRLIEQFREWIDE